VQETLQHYRRAIQSHRVNPLRRWDGESSGLIFDPADDGVPLSMLAFGACRLGQTPHRIETGDREYAFVPVEGDFAARVQSRSFSGRRPGGPFDGLPGRSNACALYVPRGETVELTGAGEMVYFSAPATGDRPPVLVQPGARPNLTRGTGVWLREVITLFTPDDVSTVLVGGETYSPPGLWSGTPLHVHDLDDPAGGESDHEEVYYHLARHTGGDWGPFGVQMLFDDQGLDESYVIHHRDAFAIPGAAHPVIAGPNSDMLYIWCLAGRSSSLGMRDVPEFAYLKKVGEILDRVVASRPRAPLAHPEFAGMARSAGLDRHQTHVLRMHLRQQGIDVVE
jgi:5-deoxy-D-glucuronate isomerase